MDYRREIDGLRAIAVVPVILFHAGFERFSGGFVGVDIFFVISGYLITTIIIGELAQGRFSLLRFYERRARRIMPALFLVLACCLPFAFAWMLPSQMVDFGKSLAAVSLFASNFLFWGEAGYFAAASEEQPLLHTWSLAVEEQYYMLFPLFLMGAWRFGRRPLAWIIAAIALASLALAEYGSVHFATATFYLPTTRVWELLAGSLCAFMMAERRPAASNVLSALGLVLIVYAVLAFNSATPFPSLYALAPVGGAALIILFGREETLAARILSTPPLVGIGLISYSLYLWHQPLFAFARIRSLAEPSPILMAGLAAASVVLAYLSWRFVELPFRQRKSAGERQPSSLRVLAATASVAILFIGTGFVATRDNGLQFRLPQEALAAIRVQENPDPIMETCIFDKGEAALPHPVRACLTPQSVTSDTILIGDSHAAAIAGEALRIFGENGADLYVMTHSACVGFSGFYVFDAKYRLRCNAFSKGIEDYIRSGGIRTVIMASRWTLYLDGTPFDNGEGGVEPLKPIYVDLFDRREENAGRDDPARKSRVLEQYIADIRAYLEDDFNVVLVYPIPEAGWNVPERIAKSALAGDTALTFSTSHQRYLERNGAVIAAFDALDHANLKRVRPDSLLCSGDNEGRCRNNAGPDEIFYFDDDHLSDAGAALIVPEILNAVRSLEAARTGSASAR